MSDLRIIIVGKIDKDDWVHNFTILDAVADALSGKIGIDQKGSASGIATLNSDSKVIQVALNSERLNGKTEAELTNLFILFATKGVADGVAELDEYGKLKAAQIPDGVVSGLAYQGGWDADTNTPTMPAADSGNTGHFFLVTKAGATLIDGIGSWTEGDWIVSKGSAWEKIPATVAPVLSVAGKYGDIALEIADIVGLEAELNGKVEIGAENPTLSETDFQSILSPGDWHLVDLSETTNGAGDDPSGPGFISVRKSGILYHQTLTMLATGEVYSNTYNSGAWTGWKKLTP